MPLSPAWMSTWSDCAKRASPCETWNDPATAPPLRTRIQVSRSGSQTPGGIWLQIDPFEYELCV